MRDLPNTAGSFGYGETSWETGDIAETAAGKTAYKELIAKANSVPLVRILRYYGVRVDAIHCISVCPFKSHKGGRENSGSFKYYDETNSFYCFGCKIGGKNFHACEFMTTMEGISKFASAHKIISLFGEDVDPNAEYSDNQNFSEQLDIMMDFSNTVREFRKSHLDKESQDFIEKRCAVYDELNARRVMDNETLRSVVEHLKEQIKIYTSCHMP
jgi:hypothetical protein